MAQNSLTHALKVAQKIQESPEACSLVFEIPPDLRAKFLYKPGQFVTLFLNINGTEVRRSYSLSSSPLVDNDFKITVKRVEGGKGSNYLMDSVKPGDILQVTPPAGQFFRPPTDLDPRHFVLFAGGSGITPIFSILKSILVQDQNKATLIYANRKQNAIVFNKELEQLASENSARLNLVHVLSQPDPGWPGLCGRCTEDMLVSVLDKFISPNDRTEYYLCGPEGFMSLIEQVLSRRGVDRGQIRRESFSSTLDGGEQLSAAVQDRVVIGKPATTQPGKLIAKVDGEVVELDYTGSASILETLLNAGYNPPYSCMDGACMACMAKVQEGQVYQDEPGILTEDNLKDNETLTCQARPVTPVVKISYDDI